MKLSSVNFNQTPGIFMPKKSSSANAEIQALEKKLQQLQKEKQKAVQRKDEEEKEKLEKQIEEIKKQIQQLKRSKEQGGKTSSVSEQKGDAYDPQPENRSVGLYKISRDEKGRPVVETGQKPQKRVSGKPDEQGEQPIIVKTTGNTDQVDREIENLKQTKTQTEQKIAAAKDEREKQVLKDRLEQVKAELRMKDNDTYRRQHMQITEQKVVSKIGE